MPTSNIRLISILAILLISYLSFGQTHTTPQFDVSVTHATFLGKTKPVSDLALIGEMSDEKHAKWKKDRKVPDNFKGRRGQSMAIIPELEHQGPDKLRQRTIGESRRDPLVPIVNIDGLYDNSGSPYDPSGDIGLNYYIQAINATRIGIFDKEGNVVTTFTGNSLWSDLGASSAGDPIILYDKEAQRWLITEFTDPANLLIAVSETSDPLGSYYTYTFSTPQFPDYPKYGIWSKTYVVTTNEAGAGTLHQYFIDREAMLAGEADVTIQRVEVVGNNNTEAGFYTSTPVHWNGNLPPVDDAPITLALHDSSWGGLEYDAIRLFRFNVDLADPSNTGIEELNIELSPFDGFPCSAGGFGFACIPQLGGGGLDGVPEVIMNTPHYRRFETHETLLLNFITDVTDGENLSGIRWVELRRTTELDWHLYQEGTFALEDGLDRFMGGIGMDKNGNIALAYNVSSAETYVGIRYTGRRSGDPLGTMTIPEVTVVDGQNTINSFGRFGDYSQMSIDPSNDVTFWFTSEYAGPQNTRTRIFSFEMSRDTFDLAVNAIRSPIDGDMLTNAELFEVEYKNLGLDTIFGFSGAIYLDNVLIEEVVFTEVLAPDDSHIHTFDTAVDMSAYGDYNIVATAEYPQDQNLFNNTLARTVNHIPSYDVAATASISAQVCSNSAPLSLSISNLGFQAVTSVTVELMLNGSMVSSEDYTLAIPRGATRDLTLEVGGLVTGENAISVQVTQINGQADTNPSDNSAGATTLLDIEAINMVFELETDEYPDETSWEIIDSQTSEVLYTGDGYEEEYTIYTEELCLSKSGCYIFVIYDSYGDGICCEYGEGNYSIFDPSTGIAYVESDGVFGAFEQIQFCPGTDCPLQIEILVNDATVSGGNGDIVIMASNGEEPFTYSIDGGQTFQASGTFSDVSMGTYDVVVADASGECTYEETVTVSGPSSTDDITGLVKIEVAPNPSEGIYSISISNSEIAESRLFLDIYNSDGQIVQSRKIGKYDGKFVGTLSLIDYPDGTYYLVMQGGKSNKIAKLIKL